MARNPKRALERGPVAERVATNLRRIRERRGLTLADVATRLNELGRAALPTGISKIEQGDRRVDVDDLVALARALDVTPNRLLLSDNLDGPIPLGPDDQTDGRQAWEWANGTRPLHDPWLAGERAAQGARFVRWRTENRPHELVDWMAEHGQGSLEVLRPVISAVIAARKDGVPMDEIVQHVKAAEIIHQYGFGERPVG